MIFTKLQLKNFKSHDDTTIEFNNGISLIVGENGAGKSTIFEAISYALFKEHNGKSISSLIRTNKDSSNQLKMSVKLSFMVNGIEYLVERERTFNSSSKTSNSSSKLFKFNNNALEILASGDRQVDNEIKDILNMDSSVFLNAIYIRQGEIADLISKTAAQRKKLIAKLLKLEELEKAYDNIPKITHDYETMRAVLESKIKSDSELNYSLKKEKQNQFFLINKIKELEETNNTLKKDIENIKNQKNQLDAKKSKYDTLKINYNNEKLNLSRLINEKEELYNKLSEILHNEKEMNLLKPYSEKLPIYNNFKMSFLRLSKFKENEKINKDKISKIKGYEEIISNEKENYDKYINLESHIKSLQDKKLNLSSDVRLLNQFKLDKENLVKDMGDANEKLATFTSQSNELLSKFDKDNFENIKTLDDLNKLDNVVEGLRIEIRSNIDDINEEYDLLNKEAISLNQEIKSLKDPISKIKNVSNKCPVCQSDISVDKKEELIKNYKINIESNNKRINIIKNNLENLKKDKSLKESSLKDLDFIKSNIYQNKHLIYDLDAFNTKLTSLTIKLKKLENKQDALNNLNEEIDTAINQRTNLEDNYIKYNEAVTLLNSSDDAVKIQDELYSLVGNINKEQENLKKYIGLDSELSLNITEEQLNNSINDLIEKDRKYNFLVGLIKNKENYQEKFNLKLKEIEDKKINIDQLRKNIDVFEYNENDYKQILLLEDRLNNKLNSNNQDLAVSKNKLDFCEKILSDMNETIDINNKNREEFVSLNKYLALLEDFRVLFSKDGVQKALRSQSKPIIQKYTREFFDKFNFNYSDLILDDEYNISLFGPEGEATLDMVSGGEKIAIALAIRLAITQAMSKGSIETILLDEPTIHLDSYRRHELIDVLRSMSIIPQMIIVTHDFELENVADTLIKVEKKDGISKVIIEDSV